MNRIALTCCLVVVALLLMPNLAAAQSRARTKGYGAPSFLRTRAYLSTPSSSRAQVTNPSFAPYRGSRGLWRGYVAGSGTIQLTLKIIRRGVVESERYIGSVVQHAWEKPTPFVFTAALPRGSDWSWLITAEAN